MSANIGPGGITPEKTDEERILEARRRARRKQRGDGDEDKISLNINSMMDMMVIILCFLLMSVGSQPMNINQGDDLRLPYSTSEIQPEDMMTITITQQYILVGDEQVIPLNDGRVDPSYLQSTESALIPELQAAVEEVVGQRERLGAQIGQDYENIATLICDKDTPYRVIAQVMVTAAAGGVQNFKFAVVQRAQGGGVVSSSE